MSCWLLVVRTMARLALCLSLYLLCAAVNVSADKRLSGTSVKCSGDACGRTPARTQPRPHTTASPPLQTASPTPVTPVARHQMKCTPAEEKKTACLNGECYALDLDGGNRSAFCHCPELYEGTRCEQLSDDFFVLYAGEVKKAGIAAGVVVIVIILTIIIVYFAVKRRKRRKREQERGAGEQEAQMNGNAAQPLMKEAVHMDTERIALNGMEKSPETNV